METFTTDVNWLPTIVAAVAAYLFGWLWYSKLFMRKWAVDNGMDPDNLPKEFPTAAMLTQGLGLLLVSLFVGLMMGMDMQLLAFFGTLAFTVWMSSGQLFGQRKTSAWIDALFWIVSVILMMLIHNLLS